MNGIAETGQDAISPAPGVPWRPLSAAAFAPYGRVIDIGAAAVVNEGHARRRDALLDLESRDPTARLCLAHFAVSPRPAGAGIAGLECHPFSAQAFLPLEDCAPLVVVALAREDGAVAAGTLAAFVGRHGQAIVYGPGVWHAPLTTADRPAGFLMAVWEGERERLRQARLDRPLPLPGRPGIVGAAAIASFIRSATNDRSDKTRGQEGV
ncbi:ureidoglycolate lyase [Chelatococcus caeni]|uniref:Ureidoglycolate lyase n=1 Tax=Chelatococcus caeni TaxID=1348468 RepID=A0A840C039_9HYPH|nr:ureidoglycolate lyase [Chelatococcus caeni]MBB4018824.1 ureidoglycolate lyase [Chelatococcus caeni]